MKIRLISGFIFVCTAIFCAVFMTAGSAFAAKQAEYRLPVFETSDTHGYLADVSEEPYQYRLAYISDKVRDARSAGGQYRAETALLLDGGDIYQGNNMSNLLEGQSLSAAYDLMDYDAVALGNHEFDWGIEATVDADGTMPDYNFDGKAHENNIPVVMSNLLQNGKRVSFTKEYVIIEKTAIGADGTEIPVRIAVIGFAENYASSIMQKKFAGLGYSISVDYEAANELARRLEEENDGLLSIDTKAHFINAGYTGAVTDDETADETTSPGKAEEQSEFSKILMWVAIIVMFAGAAYMVLRRRK